MYRAYLGLIRKEFIQVIRDRNMLRVIFMMPLVQLLLLGYAVNTDVKLLALDVYDYDQTNSSRELVRAFRAGDYFTTNDALRDESIGRLWELDDRFRSGVAEAAVILPEDFSEKITSGENVKIAYIADGADANAARIGIGYCSQIVRRYSMDVAGLEQPLSLRHKFLYNPELESVYFMVPGIVATLLTMITVMLTSMAIVREREMGTLEQISVTPISTTALLLGKTTTFAILGMAEMVAALAFGVLWFGIPFVGSPLLLFALSALYLATTLGLGMFISTVTSTQQQAMFLAWFFSIFAILTSGFFTPIGNMPEIMQYVTYVNPLRYFVEIVRGIMMKGSGIADLWPSITAIAIYGVLIFSLAMLRFSKRVA